MRIRRLLFRGPEPENTESFARSLILWKYSLHGRMAVAGSV